MSMTSKASAETEQIEIEVESTINESFRVAKVRGFFDIAAADKDVQRFEVELPSLDGDWRVGLIVGPSGSGKSTVARHALKQALYKPGRWKKEQAVIDGFPPEHDVETITAMLTAVGFSSPPAWLRPYQVLSNGEQFRCELARALLGKRRLVVFDEYTSVVDRTVAKVGSLAVQKAIRAKPIDDDGKQFVAVTCHYDVAPWLRPDWVLDMSTCQLARGCLQRRRKLRFTVHPCGSGSWRVFRRHHYLSGALHRNARCYVAITEDGAPAAFAATLNNAGHVGRRRMSRIVVLPDYQGIGIGGQIADVVVRHEMETFNCPPHSLTASHPAMIRALDRSSRWVCTGVLKSGNTNRPAGRGEGANPAETRGRAVVHFRYTGADVQ